MKATGKIILGLLTVVMTAAVNAGFSQPITFTKITTGAIVNDLGEFLFAVWGDFSNDGFLDLFVSNWNDQTNVFYRNNGDGTFTKITNRDPVQDADYHVGAAIGDYDNDGNLDLLVSAGVGAPTARRSLLYHNNGGGTFSRECGGSVTNQLGYFGPCVFGDYDNDGFLDLFIGNRDALDQTGAKNLLFHNNGDGTFTKVTAGSVVNDVGDAFGAAWADYDNDGFMDLIVINNRLANSHNFLYHNNRDGTFTGILTNAIATDSWQVGAQCGAWGDYDNDGMLDLFVTDNSGVRNHLYHNNGNGTFTNVTSGPMLQPPPGGPAVGCAWGDYDNDGYLDLFISNYGGNNALFHNNGDGTFVQVLSGDPVQHSGGGTCSWVDYDNDGFLDLFLTGGEPGPLPNLLYHNNGNSNAWLEVKCVGTVANRSAIGAKVRVHASIGGKTFWQLREINNGGGWNSVPLVAHFGLGDATNVDTLRIEWPSGTVQEFPNVPAKQILTITEPPRLLTTTTNGTPQFYLKGGRGFQYEVDSSPDLSAWSSIGVLTITNLNGTTTIVDTNPPALDQRFYRAVSR